MYKKITTILFLLLFVVSNGTIAKMNADDKNQTGISFKRSSWQEILKLAENENKLIFLDCYTAWCGPCKIMDKTVFTDPEVGSYFNQHFINVKLDMEKEPGIGLKEQFKITAFPTLLFIDANQNMIHKRVGALSKTEFLQLASDVVSGTNSLSAYNKKYQEIGVSDIGFVVEYLQKLEAANEKNQTKQVISQYFNQLQKEDLLKEQNWELTKKYVHNINNKAFQYLLNNQSKFEDKFGENEIRNKIYDTFLWEGNRLCDQTGSGKFKLNAHKKAKFLADIEKYQIKDKEKLKAYSEIATARVLENWPEYAAKISQHLKAGNINSNEISLYNYALPVSRATEDIIVRKIAAGWCDLGLEIEGVSQAYKDAFSRLKAKLLTVNNDQ